MQYKREARKSFSLAEWTISRQKWRQSIEVWGPGKRVLLRNSFLHTKKSYEEVILEK